VPATRKCRRSSLGCYRPARPLRQLQPCISGRKTVSALKPASDFAFARLSLREPAEERVASKSYRCLQQRVEPAADARTALQPGARCRSTPHLYQGPKGPSARRWSWATDRPTYNQGGAGSPHLAGLRADLTHPELGGRPCGGRDRRAVHLRHEGGGRVPHRPATDAVHREGGPLSEPHSNVQITLGTTVTDTVAGPPRVLAVSAE